LINLKNIRLNVILVLFITLLITACTAFSNTPYRQRINYLGNNTNYIEIRQYGLQDARKLKILLFRNIKADCDKFNVFDEYQVISIEAMRIWYNRNVNETIGGAVYSCKNGI
jgi:hypothetical protein